MAEGRTWRGARAPVSVGAGRQRMRPARKPRPPRLVEGLLAVLAVIAPIMFAAGPAGALALPVAKASTKPAGASTGVAGTTTQARLCGRASARADAPPCVANGITAAAEKIIARQEAPGGKPELKPYNDADRGPTNCTIGIGHLIHAGKCTADDFQHWKGATAESLLRLFHDDIASRERELNQNLIDKLHLMLDPCQYDALFDLYFNGGPSWFKPGTSLYKAFAQGDLKAVPAILAADVPAKLSPDERAVIQSRREQDANRFAASPCPCRFINIYGTVRFYQYIPQGTGQNMHLWADTQTGTFVIDVITKVPPAPGINSKWSAAGSTFQATDEVKSGGSCPYSGHASDNGTLPTGPLSPGYADQIVTSWSDFYTPPRVGFIIDASISETITNPCFTPPPQLAIWEPTCPGNDYALGYITGKFNRRNSTITIRCSQKGDTNSDTISISGTLSVYNSWS